MSSNSFEIAGRLIAVMDIVERPSRSGGDPFRTREAVIEVANDLGNGRIITNYIKFQMVMDKTLLVDQYQIGDNIKVSFNLRGTKYISKTTGQEGYITNLDAWRIDRADAAGGGAAQGGAPASAGQYNQPMNNAPAPAANTGYNNAGSPDAGGATDDDLPF